MTVCYYCGKEIKGKMILHVPAIYLIKLGVDFEKSYHPACFRREDIAAGRELREVS